MKKLAILSTFAWAFAMTATDAAAEVCGMWAADLDEPLPKSAKLTLSLETNRIARAVLVSVSGEGFIWQIRSDGHVAGEFGATLPETTVSTPIDGQPVLIDISPLSRIETEQTLDSEPAVLSISVHCAISEREN